MGRKTSADKGSATAGAGAGTSVPRRVLVVEDERHQRAMLTRAVTEMGFEVTAAASAEAGLEMIAANPPSVAILDLNLPGMSGLELAAVLQERLPSTRLIILTGYGDLPAAREAIRLEVVDFLLKPCPLDELEKALSRAYAKAVSESGGANAKRQSTAGTEAPADTTGAPKGPVKIDDAERELILQALNRHDGNRTKAAAELGISVRTLYYRLSRYDVEGRRG